MRRLPLALLAAVLLAPALHAPPAMADEAPPAKPLRIAVIDTGINASHPEFAPGQVVAWRDFTAQRSPVPVDGHGHGTATASLVAGLNVGCGKDKLSFAPGAQLVIARVGTDSGSITGSVTQAALWAAEQGADVISISIGSIVPLPTAGETFTQLRNKGVLVVVSAGNGAGGYGLAPIPTWSNAYGNDKSALAVGGGTRNGGTLFSTTGNLDPDVTSWSDGVCVARHNGVGYARMSGTSFSAPLVAGMAGKAMELARQNGQPSSPDHVERLLLLSATNLPQSPYAREGLGFLLDREWLRVAAHAAAGTLPDYPAQGPHAVLDLWYHDVAIEALRQLQ